MPPEVRERMWESGFTTKETGSGIGMGVIKKGIEASDGRLLLCNSELGAGTEFIFAFRIRGEVVESGSERVLEN